ncbi:sulfotransferase [Fontimonas sp. SYSU GA230001]|uniref:sulfotransferase family protein n=1 Tax=Fontimonas sp. SYSU GA230001 TaxID=3142450 RepID=UPI0032B60324
MTTQTTSTAAPVAILGMHRSGTSCLAGSLEEAGLFLGEVNTQAPFNARGNRENRAIMDLHDDVLRANGGAWDQAPREPVAWTAEQRARLRELIDGFPTDRVWGFKEPRSLLVLDGWIEALPALRFVGTFRHPLAVAASLAARNQFDTDTSFRIWLAYNRRLLAYQQRYRFPLVSFDWPHERYLHALEALAAQLGLAPPAGGFQFFARELRKNSATPDVGLPPAVREVYARLLSIAA